MVREDLREGKCGFDGEPEVADSCGVDAVHAWQRCED